MLRYIYTYTQLHKEQLLAVYHHSLKESVQRKHPIRWESKLWEAEEDFLDYLRSDFFRCHGAYYAVWEEEGEYCSVLRMQPQGNEWLLTGLETTFEKRGNGYAKNLILAVQADLAPGTRVISHVHRKNQASTELHLKTGFVSVRNFAKYLDGTVDGGADTLLFLKT